MSGKVGDNLFRASGVIAAAAAGGGVSWQAVTTASTLTVEAGKGYPINTTSNACTVTLPTSASVGDEIILTDYARTWATNNLTISSSLNYQGSSSIDPVYDTDGESIHIVYQDVTKGWIPIFDGAVAYETEPAAYVTATGPDDAAGVVASDDADYKVHEFTASKTGSNGFSVSNAGNSLGSNTVEYILVAGGGGGAYSRGAAGGAGGMRTATGLSVTVQDYDITIGGGGAGVTSGTAAGANGSASSGIGLATVGGGGGGSTANAGVDGGSGGGATNDTPGVGGGTAGEGNDGGPGAGAPNYGAGGGGGKGAVGGSGLTNAGGPGGTGLNSSIRQTGVATGYAGGGGGGCYNAGSGGAATHGGGNGGNGSGTGTVGADGTTNTGGGGGGGGHGEPSPRAGGSGGSGIMIIRYKFQN
jgi:hypothetical protein